METKILAAISLATPEQLESGLRWYEKANEECKLIADCTGIELSIVVGVLAALSPRNKWARNIRDTWDIIADRNCKVCTFNGQKEKAIKILDSDGELRTVTGILKGEKTVNFFMNIFHYDKDNLEPVIDVWGYRLLDLAPTPKNYKVAAKAYKEVANELGYRVQDLQAVTWGVIRGSLA